jgi:cytochrome c-type biogenesis protein CcmH/NrfG
MSAPHPQDADAALAMTLEALRSRPGDGELWRALGMAHEMRQEFDQAVAAYERALQLMPEQAAIAGDLGRLAHRLGMPSQARQLLAAHLQAEPDSCDSINTLACVLRDQHDYAGAIGLLQQAIGRAPSKPRLWNTLGTVLSAQGDCATACTFFEEALRLDPGHPGARYNLACAELDLGDVDAALKDCELALGQASEPAERATIRFGRATMLLCAGRLGEGWDAYEARFDPDLPNAPIFETSLPRLSGSPAHGALMVMAEQGVGDEVMFSSLLPDLTAERPDATVAVEPRLVRLFQRSFPGMCFVPHTSQRIAGRRRRGTPEEPVSGAWEPMASLARRYRRTLADFPDRRGYLIPDPQRVEHWRGWLSGLAGRKVGLLWKGSNASGARMRQYCPFPAWSPVLRTPGISFVSLQYGDWAAEQAMAAAMGVQLSSPPGVDLREDLDEVAALSAALDLVIGPANATTNLAGACGKEVWFLATPMAWPQLGTGGHPWYPQARVFAAERYGDWGAVMAEMAAALA